MHKWWIFDCPEWRSKWRSKSKLKFSKDEIQKQRGVIKYLLKLIHKTTLIKTQPFLHKIQTAFYFFQNLN